MDCEKDKIYLNLGCGDDIRNGWVNLDLPDNPDADVNVDLEEAKLPFKDNSVLLIEASHVLEHIHNYIPLMKELHRVLVLGGILHIRVPEFPCAASIADPTHVRYFTPQSFEYLAEHHMGYDTSGLRGLFELRFIESLPHDRGSMDRAHVIAGERYVWQRYFTEVEVELEKRGK